MSYCLVIGAPNLKDINPEGYFWLQVVVLILCEEKYEENWEEHISRKLLN